MNDVHAPRTLPARPAAWKLAALAIAAATLAGCASKVPLDTKPPVENRSGTPVAPTAAAPGSGTGAPAAQSTVATVDLARQTADEANRAGRVILFDFDSFVVRDQFRPIVEAHAKALNANPQRRLSIEGHTDERGSREYNLALGQRRAEAVVRSLTLLGAKDAQVEAVSFGEERPAAQGSSEDAWAQNRRAELNVKP